jgi:hypothetical protein
MLSTLTGCWRKVHDCFLNHLLQHHTILIAGNVPLPNGTWNNLRSYCLDKQVLATTGIAHHTLQPPLHSPKADLPLVDDERQNIILIRLQHREDKQHAIVLLLLHGQEPEAGQDIACSLSSRKPVELPDLQARPGQKQNR